MKTWLYPLWVIIDILVFVTSVALWIAAPEYKSLNLGLLAFALSLGALLVMIKFPEIKAFVRSSYFEKVLYHFTNAFLVIAILGLVNYLGNKNYREFDLSKSKQNSLTEQTQKVLEMVNAPLKLTVFAKREEWQGILNVLKLYKARNRKISIEAVDTDLRPDLVKAKEITQNGTIIISYKGKDSKFVINDELSITNALLKSLRTKALLIYTVTGDQELDCATKTNEGISVICERVTSQNYKLKPLDLTKVTEVPADGEAVLVLGPIKEFLPQETKILEAFLKRGGSMFLALAPAFNSKVYDGLVALARPYGLVLGNDIVIDRMSTVQGAEATIPIVNHYSPNHPITTGFNQRTIFPLSSSVRTIPGKDSAELLAFTSEFPGSWAETDLKGVTAGKAAFQEKSDQRGPVGLLGIGETLSQEGGKSSRFILLGSSSFLINAYQSQAGNSTLFLNSLSWMLNDEGIISFNRPGIEESPVILSALHLQMIFVFSILLIPLVFFGTAIFIYRRRRLL